MLNCKRLDIIQNHPTFFFQAKRRLIGIVPSCYNLHEQLQPGLALVIFKWRRPPNGNFNRKNDDHSLELVVDVIYGPQFYNLWFSRRKWGTHGYPIFRPRISLELYKRVSHVFKIPSSFFSPRKKRDLKIFYPFWWTTKPGFGKRGMQKGLSWGWNNQWISRIKNGVFLCPLVRSVNLQMLGNTCDSSEPEIFRNSVGHMAFLQMRAKPSFFCWTCGSHHKPLHVTVGITMWLWLTVCHGKIHHAIKPSISMGHESIPWRTVSHNQRVTHVEIHFCLLSLRWPVYLSMHQPISMRVPRGPKESHAPMSFWHRPWWCAMS